MNEILVFNVVAVALFSLMALRAFSSGSATDYLLGGAQCAGLVLLLTDYSQIACYFLLFTACLYLLSQIMTQARLASRLLPIAGAASIVLLLLA